jgi:hypothetical protein
MGRVGGEEFTVDGTTFSLQKMKVRASFPLYKHVTALLRPVLSATQVVTSTQAKSSVKKSLDGEVESTTADDSIAELMPLLLAVLGDVETAMDHLEPLADAFAKNCMVVVEGVARGVDSDDKRGWFTLEPRFDTVFERNHAKMFEWLAHCVLIEYESFLAKFGLSRADLMESLSDFQSG